MFHTEPNAVSRFRVRLKDPILSRGSLSMPPIILPTAQLSCPTRPLSMMPGPQFMLFEVPPLPNFVIYQIPTVHVPQARGNWPKNAGIITEYVGIAFGIKA